MINIIRITFLMLANAIILVHSFIPHYDTANGVHCCTAEHHFQAEGTHDFHLSGILFPPETTENHGGISFDYCLLDRIYVRFDNNNHLLQSSDSEIVALLASLFICSDNSSLSLSVSEIFSPLPKPYTENSFTNEFVSSFGLRAPPFC